MSVFEWVWDKAIENERNVKNDLNRTEEQKYVERNILWVKFKEIVSLHKATKKVSKHAINSKSNKQQCQ